MGRFPGRTDSGLKRNLPQRTPYARSTWRPKSIQWMAGGAFWTFASVRLWRREQLYWRRFAHAAVCNNRRSHNSPPKRTGDHMWGLTGRGVCNGLNVFGFCSGLLARSWNDGFCFYWIWIACFGMLFLRHWGSGSTHTNFAPKWTAMSKLWATAMSLAMSRLWVGIIEPLAQFTSPAIPDTNPQGRNREQHPKTWNTLQISMQIMISGSGEEPRTTPPNMKCIASNNANHDFRFRGRVEKSIPKHAMHCEWQSESLSPGSGAKHEMHCK